MLKLDEAKCITESVDQTNVGLHTNYKNHLKMMLFKCVDLV